MRESPFRLQYYIPGVNVKLAVETGCIRMQTTGLGSSGTSGILALPNLPVRGVPGALPTLSVHDNHRTVQENPARLSHLSLLGLFGAGQFNRRVPEGWTHGSAPFP